MDRETAKKNITENFIINIKEGIGWITLVDILYDNKPPEIDIIEVFEKYSSLEVVYEGENKQFEELVHMLSFMSTKVCQICGKSGGYSIIDGWEITLCDEHYHETEGKVKYRPEK